MSNGNIEQIEIHIRTYRSLLKSAGTLSIEKLADSHRQLNSILHEKSSTDEHDMAAFIYSLLRLPSLMSTVKKVIMGQSIRVFKNNSFAHIKDWQLVAAVGRRRKMYFNGKDTLAVYIASVTDVDDLLTLMTAFQIEWNKLHAKLKNSSNVRKTLEELLDKEDIVKIQKIWGGEYHKFLTAIKYRKVNLSARLLSGSYMEYSRATQHWWDHIEKSAEKIDFLNRPIYFVSSNTHSLINLSTRFVLNEEKTLIEFLYQNKDKNLISIWENITKGIKNFTREYFLYYLAKKALRHNKGLLTRKTAAEKKLGILNIPSKDYLDIDAQIIPLNKLSQSPLSKLLNLDLNALSQSKSVIVNIDYPLGWAAYQVLTEIGQNVGQIMGVYIMGKSATLNGQIGDVLIPNTVYDMHTKNVYAINNAFRTADFLKIFKNGTVLDYQKTVTTKGTFLESAGMIENWFREGYTDIEMEAGPYLNAVYEFVHYNRYEENEFINLSSTPFELAIAHYASDTPYSKAKNLGVRNLSYEGVESTYAISEVILTKIVEQELRFLK